MKHTATAKKGLLKAATYGLAGISLLLAQGSIAAENEWSFGIGTGISLLDLDGDVGVPTDDGGAIFELDLGNDDTADMFESAFGFVSFANKGRWTIHLSYATLTLEDSESNIDAEWDRVEANLAVEYALYQTGNHTFSVLGGVRYFDHDWEFDIKGDPREQVDAEEDWTDGVFGLTHRMTFAGNWAWVNKADYMFGDSEGGYSLSTGLNWQPYESWVFSAGVGYKDLEFGEEEDINKNDFYLYDVDETTINIGFLYLF